MQFKSFLLLLIFIFFWGCSNKIGQHLKSQISNAKRDFIIVKPDIALFVFKIDKNKSWHWYQKTTSIGQAEYGWWATFELDNRQYTCGFRLFKPPFSEPESGSFKELIDAGQVDLASRKVASKKQFGDGLIKINILSKRNNNADVEATVISNKLIIFLKEQDIINQFRAIRPDSILLHKQTDARKFERSKVAVIYSSK